MKMEKTLNENKDVQADQPIATELNAAGDTAGIETSTAVQTLEQQDVMQGLMDEASIQEPVVEFTENPTPKPKDKSRKRRKSAKAEPVSVEPEVQLDPAVLSDAQPSAGENADQDNSLSELEGKLEELSRSVEQAGEFIADSTSVAEELIESTQQIADDPQSSNSSISESSAVESNNASVEPTQLDEQIQTSADEIVNEQSASDLNAGFENDLTGEPTSENSSETATLINEPESIDQNVETTEPVATNSIIDTGSVAEVETQTQPEVVPEIETPREILEPRVQIKRSANYSSCLAVHHDRGGKIAEEYRALRTNLLSKYRDDRFCFMVASAEAGEGKTVTCLNLGLIMAERLDRRTIVVDYNLRDGSMAKHLGADQGPGITDVLLGTATLDEVIQPTAYPNLFFVAAGRNSADRAGELMSRSTVKDIIDQLKHNYDYVLLDTPAINTYSDAGITGLAANDALFVVRMNKTPRESIERAILSLQATSVNIVGMLLTHRQPRWFK
jgi:capsular exopolysaccharide synthesis family protein